MWLLLCEHLLISLTKGVGIREVILTNGCPGGESKCVVRVEECRGPVDCGCKLNPYLLKEGLCWERPSTSTSTEYDEYGETQQLIKAIITN